MFQNVPVRHTLDFHGQKITLETGLLAQQATATVLASSGGTSVMAAVVVGKKSQKDYMPLQVIYEERLYASGKIKGSRFLKREGRPTENAILTGRLIDRSLRSLFNKNIRQEIQVIITVLSLDEENQPDTLAILAASCALSLANIVDEDGNTAFYGPVGSVRVGELQLSLGSVVVSQVVSAISGASSFDSISQTLEEAAELLQENNVEDEEAVKKIFSALGRKNPEWAKKYRTIFNNTSKLHQSEIHSKYKLKPQFIINGTYAEQEKSIMDVIVSGTQDSIVMIEAGAHFVNESHLTLALDTAQQNIQTLTEFQKEFIYKASSATSSDQTEVFVKNVDENTILYLAQSKDELERLLYSSASKEGRKEAVTLFTHLHTAILEIFLEHIEAEEKLSVQECNSLVMETLESLDIQVFSESVVETSYFYLTKYAHEIDQIQSIIRGLSTGIEELFDLIVKDNIVHKQRRLDGRKTDEVRPISCQVGMLAQTHGSSLFQRGETQVLNILTVGTQKDAQLLDNMEDFEETTKSYIHHYNFPSYSVGETGRYGGPSRRDIGHGALAERALLPVLPNQEQFPYTLRLVSECLGSNGSTSMASTCASTLSLLDAGVPIKEMIAGIAMGVVQSSDSYQILTDIMGAEDHHGEMDFKVTGSDRGITAIQLDNKVAGLTLEVLSEALEEARKGRLHILGKMKEVISQPRESLSKNAPRVLTTTIPIEKIGDVIGPSGKIIKAIVQDFGVEIDIRDEDGRVFVYGKDVVQAQAALDHILKLVKEYTPGEIVEVTVFRIEHYGAFVKIDGTDKEGLIHISEIAPKRIEKVTDEINMNDTFKAVIKDVDDKGKISLSIKQLNQKSSDSKRK